MLDYSRLEEHLSHIHAQMKPFQRSGVAMGRKQRKVIIELIMGAGKTLVGLCVLFCFKPERLLLISSKNAFYTWQKEINKWFPGMLDTAVYRVIKGTPEQRRKLWALPTDIYVCTYDTWRIDKEYVEKTLRLKFPVVGGDEVHKIGRYKVGKNKKTGVPFSQKYKALMDTIKSSQVFVGLSGGLAKKGPQDLWHYLHLLDPRFWSSYWRFVDQFCLVEEGFWGKEIVGAKNEKGLATQIRPYIFRAPEAKDDLPELIRDYLPVDPTPKQWEMYRAFSKDMYLQLESEARTIFAPNPAVLFLRHRQLLTTPRILDGGAEYGAGLEMIVDKAQDEEETHFAIFTMFTKAIPHIRSYLSSQGYNHIYSLQGGASLEEIRDQTEACKKNRGVFIGSILFAQSYEIETCRLGFMLGPDWDVQNNEQAEARIRRLTSEHPVKIYYIMHPGTCDERVYYDILDPKARGIRQTYKDANDFAAYWAPKGLL